MPVPQNELHTIKHRQPAEIDPIDEARVYVNKYWIQELRPCRSKCYRCGIGSPIIHVPIGTIAFGNQKMLRSKQDRDITNDVVMAYAEIGWKFQRYRCYCQVCKNMGSV